MQEASSPAQFLVRWTCLGILLWHWFLHPFFCSFKRVVSIFLFKGCNWSFSYYVQTKHDLPRILWAVLPLIFRKLLDSLRNPTLVSNDVILTVWLADLIKFWPWVSYA
ncbi:unnamed protein product [Prunus armeniaca]